MSYLDHLLLHAPATAAEAIIDPVVAATMQPSLRLFDTHYEALVQLWILRVIVPLGAHKRMLSSEELNDDNVLRAIGLGAIEAMEQEGAYVWADAIRLISARYREIEARGVRIPSRRPLERNLKGLARRLGLSSVDLAILRLLVIAQQCEFLSVSLIRLGGLTLRACHRTLAILLDIDESRIASALAPGAVLATTGLVMVDSGSNYHLELKVELLSGIADRLCAVQQDPLLMLRNWVEAGKPAQLTLSDYPHAHDHIRVLTRYLGHGPRRAGVNVLVFGPPGTGKTEFVRMFAQETGRQLYEVATQETDSQPLSGSQRLQAFRLAQQMLRKDEHALVLFDEIEDVFRESPQPAAAQNPRNAAGKKAWINQTLETNPVPAFWLTNDVEPMDPAIIRRFDYVMELGNPPRNVRQTIIQRYFGQAPVREQWVGHLSEHECLSPALIERAARVVACMDDMAPQDLERVATRLINGSLEAMSLPSLTRPEVVDRRPYRPECLNTTPPVQDLATRLAASGRGRLCLYGPPGTGKTAFGRHLARLLGRPLHVKRASDILSAYVGGTEKGIAAMFAEAADDKAVLLLDEADSFLRARDSARHSWEITQVNEMLTRMETFEGIFIASTNFMDVLDEATLRRFDLKVRFDWLQPEQARQMFDDLLAQLDVAADPSAVSRVAGLGALTPGDFAQVARQAELRPFASATDVCAALAEEMRARPRTGGERRIGF